MHILCLQHVFFETPAAIANWAKDHECEITCIDVPSVFSLERSEQHLPDCSTFDLLLLMGGPMGVYEEEAYPWLAQEKAFIREAIAADKFVLGICLGAQLIAAALGANVFPGEQKEIGWFPIRLTSEGRCSGLFEQLEQGFCPLHWHGDTFDLPADSVLLASSTAYANQAFMYKDKVVGLQFHLEIRPQDASLMIEHCGNELTEGTFVQSAEKILGAQRHFSRSNVLLTSFLDRWLSRLLPASTR